MNGQGIVPSSATTLLHTRMRWCCHFGILNRSLLGQLQSTFVLLKHPKPAAAAICSRPLELRRQRKRWLTIAQSSQRASDLGRPQRWTPGRGLRFTKDIAISWDSKPRVWPIRHLSDGCAAQRSTNHPTEVATNNEEFINANISSNLSRKSVLQPSNSKVTRAGAARLACPGCGVYMQDKNPKAPGFFKRPAFLDESVTEETEALSEADEALNEEEDELDDDEEEEVVDDAEISSSQEWQENNWVLKSGKWEELEKAELKDEINGFGPAGPGYGSWNEVGPSSEDAKNAWNDELNLKVKSKKGAKEAKEEGERLVVCARCHSLRSYGQVKDESVENLLPEFDFEQAVGTRLMKAYGRRAVVVMVIDSVDFDGSFPRRVAALLAEADKKFASAWKGGASGNVPRLIVAATKVDLLPGQVSPVRLEQWVRRRVVDGGAPRPSGVHLISSKKGWGLQALTDQITRLSGPRGDVWVVGSQNAGKSSLINALGKLAGQKNKPSAQLTEAPVPGTTVGVLKLEGILPARARLYDTPGILHPHQITTRLSRDEQKLVQGRKELKPRTFRVKVGNTVHVGGLLRLDIVKTPTESIYITIWASPLVPCHLGKTEKADETLEKHIGERLQPPLDKKRLPELGKWLPRIVQVSGDNWTASSVDVAVAGLGWVAVALKGDATLSVWTYEGIAVTRHEAMVHDLATVFEKPGFTIDKGPTKTEGKSGSLTKKPGQKIQIN